MERAMDDEARKLGDEAQACTFVIKIGSFVILEVMRRCIGSIREITLISGSCFNHAGKQD